MIKYSFKPEKKLAQYFLVDEKVINFLVENAKINKNDIVVEIGAGCGFITRELIKKCKKLIAYEVDEKLQNLLKEEFKDYKNFELRGNFLKSEKLECNKVVGSLPYNISSEIMYMLFDANFDLALLIVDDEFAEKLTSFEGMPNYTAITVLTQYFFDIKILKKIPKESFFPVPKTNSILLKLKKRKFKIEAKNEKKFIIFIKTLFYFKNKNLRNALNLAYKKLNRKIDLEKIESKLEKYLDEKVILLPISSLVKIFNSLEF